MEVKIYFSYALLVVSMICFCSFAPICAVLAKAEMEVSMINLVTLKGEIIKIHKNYFISLVVVFSMLVWPIINYFAAYYVYLSFDLSTIYTFGISDYSSLMVFMVTGFLGYSCFWAMVQSAWQVSYERQNGTLELIMMTPASRLSILYGRALGALFESTWMFAVFAIIIILYSTVISITMIFYLCIAFFILILSSTIWGGFMNALFLTSRDSGFLFYILGGPMELFSGVRVPVEAFPFWAKVISTVFPLSYCLTLIREVFATQMISLETIMNLFGVLLVLILLTSIVASLAENNLRNNGSYTLY